MADAYRKGSIYKQERFAEEYMKDQDMTQAAIRAGYARKGAAASGRRLLENERVQERIRKLSAEQEKKDGQCPALERQEVLDFLTLVLRGGQGNRRFSLTNQAETEEGYSIQERMRAAELLGRSQRWFGGMEFDIQSGGSENQLLPE